MYVAYTRGLQGAIALSNVTLGIAVIITLVGILYYLAEMVSYLPPLRTMYAMVEAAKRGRPELIRMIIGEHKYAELKNIIITNLCDYIQGHRDDLAAGQYNTNMLERMKLNSLVDDVAEYIVDVPVTHSVDTPLLVLTSALLLLLATASLIPIGVYEGVMVYYLNMGLIKTVIQATIILFLIKAIVFIAGYLLTMSALEYTLMQVARAVCRERKSWTV